MVLVLQRLSKTKEVKHEKRNVNFQEVREAVNDSHNRGSDSHTVVVLYSGVPEARVTELSVCLSYWLQSCGSNKIRG